MRFSGYHVCLFYAELTCTGTSAAVVQRQSRPKSRSTLVQTLSTSLLSWSPPTPAKHITWELKRSEINRVIYEHLREKSMSSTQRLEVDLGHGKYNPRLKLSLFPHGVYDDEDKYATLEVGVKIPKKCPRLPSAAEAKVTVSAWDCSGKEIGGKQVAAVSLNLRTVLIKQFVSHDALKHSMSDIVEIRAEVQPSEGGH